LDNNKQYVGDYINSKRASWTFKGNVASSFEKHVSKSVPGYEEGHQIISSLSDFFLTKEYSQIIDIGCSTGSLIEKLSLRHKNKKFKFLGIDPVPEMCYEARKKSFTNSKNNIEFVNNDFLTYEVIDKVSIYISYYTMQFIHTSVRQDFINKVYKTLEWGGAFFLFEKIRAPDARFQDYMMQVYNDFKLSNGYSIEEIYKKTESIRGVLEPFSEQGNIDLFQRAGFKDFATIYHNICFRGWLLIK
tara:strand:+ start:1995 stop:2729 length:735 start_codon:yes stop_codon:yes gene_type:complete